MTAFTSVATPPRRLTSNRCVGHTAIVPPSAGGISWTRVSALPSVEGTAPRRPLLAAHGILVGYPLDDRWCAAGHLLKGDLPALQVDVIHAASRGAVDAMGGPGHAVPRPFVAVAAGFARRPGGGA